MTVARAWTIALVGLEGHLVEIEADLAQGLPGLNLVGLPDTTVYESRDRVRAAMVNSGEAWPQRRITVGLSPASLPKRGSQYDVPMAAAILAAAGRVPPEQLTRTVLLGELGLDGRVRAVRGVLPAVLAAARRGVEQVVVPAPNAAEARLVPGVSVVGIRHLRELVALLRDEPPPDLPEAPTDLDRAAPAEARGSPGAAQDLADVLGQAEGRRALEVAAAGGHHLLLVGTPGAGKTMLAERLPGLLPPLDRDASLEVTAIHSVAGALPADTPLVTVPPFRNPHHSASVAALVGGGSNVARPGEVSLAHRGVLFLDEAPEFAGGVLDALRQPLESGWVAIARAGGTVRYPARFVLVLAANPCACAGGGPRRACTCSPVARRRYADRLSAPLLDRVDVRLRVLPVSRADLLRDRPEPTAVVAARVAEARARASARFVGTPWRSNAEVPGPELRGRYPPSPDAMRDAHRLLERGGISARGLDRVLRVAWTLADLAGVDRPTGDHVADALSLRHSWP